MQVFKKGKKGQLNMIMRPLCSNCKQRPKAVNYHKNGKVFYRKQCEICVKNKGKILGLPRWQMAGYVKKTECDKCSYKSKHPQQFNVYHMDGNLNNCRYNNLKTICANCQRMLQIQGFKWTQGDLLPDV